MYKIGIIKYSVSISVEEIRRVGGKGHGGEDDKEREGRKEKERKKK
jgi:hypothetical protein